MLLFYRKPDEILTCGNTSQQICCYLRLEETRVAVLKIRDFGKGLKCP